MKKKTFIILATGVVVSTSAMVFLLPRYLMSRAVEKPTEMGQMVTQPVEAPDLSDKLEASLGQPQNQTEHETPSHSQHNTTRQDTDSSDTPEESVTSTQVLSVPTVPEENSSLPEQKTQRQASPAQKSDTLQPALKDIQNNTHQSAPTSQQPTTSQDQKRFQVSLSENELAGMVYNGLHRGIDPRYKEALQGVSVKINQGYAKLNIALLPRHLPAAYLKSLPGITRESPTIYMGGEISLAFDKHTVKPQVHNVSLGNLKIPMPMIQSMIKHQFHAYLRQMTKLDSGQQAILDNVYLNQGKMTIMGHIRAQS